jgi:16S rRNA (cytosine967-C5)-methyltransferase
MKTINPRQIALNILNKFFHSNQNFLEKIINDFFLHNQFLNKDKAFINELVYGVVRWQIKIDYILNLYSNKNISNLHPIILNVLRLALYQLFFLDKVPNFATVNEAVNLIKRSKLNKLAGFVNAILRSIISNKKELNLNKNDINHYLSIEYSHPQWLVERLISQYGIEETEQILESNNQRAKTTIRVNLSKSSVDEVKDFLQKEQIDFIKNDLFPNCFVIEKTTVNIVDSKLFQDGKITIQDTSAMLCASLTVPDYSDLIFDLCAAPGGKTCYIAEQMKINKENFIKENFIKKNPCTVENLQGKIIANDIYLQKIQTIKKNAERLNFSNIEYVCGDALDFEYEKKADIVLLDVPCSGIGTISKKPDIKHLRKEKDFADLIDIQRKLLLKASELIKIGGALVYSTCSIDKEENIKNIEWFLQNNNQFSLDCADKFIAKSYCEDGFLQCFSHKKDFSNKQNSAQQYRIDGAFAARLIKN